MTKYDRVAPSCILTAHNYIRDEVGEQVRLCKKNISHPQLVLYFSALTYVRLPLFPGILEYGSQSLRIIKDAKIQHPPAADGITSRFWRAERYQNTWYSITINI